MPMMTRQTGGHAHQASKTHNATMHRISRLKPYPLFDSATTRALEQSARDTLAPHTLMQRAGLEVAKLALALAPHARTIWVACGPGNNGGDGLEAALHLHRSGKQVVVTWLGEETRTPQDALAALLRARSAGVVFSADPPPHWDFCIDALLGTGLRGASSGRMANWIQRINHSSAPVLAVDVPSGLSPDTGHCAISSIAKNPDLDGVEALFTLSLLTLKPGLFTAVGRDKAGEVWFSDLGVEAPLNPQALTGQAPTGQAPCAMLGGPPAVRVRPHASHKGSYGDVTVIGGARGMTGAALLAASAALNTGAGRVFLGLLDDDPLRVDPLHPELMIRPVDGLDLSASAVVCGCGAGQSVNGVLPNVLSSAPRLVLDADALNGIAGNPLLQSMLSARQGRNQETVLTPHPLEAARLLGCSAADIQANRLLAAQQLATRFQCVTVLKGSGTVIAAPQRLPVINPTGNARLATAGSGDVLAGLIGAGLAGGMRAFDAACAAVYQHGLVADQWPTGTPLVASRLAGRITTEYPANG
jgi:hydroxyethylthiazole kinase-like uncharacterized protein yjeF